jgi:hypothetical protein
MKQRIAILIALLSLTLAAVAQHSSSNSGTSKQAKDIDPLALQVLKAATDPLHSAKTFSFKALVSREHVGSNGQLITLFHLSAITMQRPDKLHVNFRGKGQEVELFYDAGHSVLFTPEAKLYTTVSSPTTVDAALDALEKKDVFLPVRNFLESDPYQSLTKDLTTAYVIGQVMLFDQPVHQLAFTEPGADWQLWVVGGEKPIIRRLEVVDKTIPSHPRIIVDFLDWNLEANVSEDQFAFTKPPDAKEIQLLRDVAKK